MEKVAWKHIPYQLKERTSRDLLCDSGSSNPMLCGNLEGWDGLGGGREVQGGGPEVPLWLIMLIMAETDTRL